MNPGVLLVMNPGVLLVMNPGVLLVMHPRVLLVMNPRVLLVMNPRVLLVMNPRVLVVVNPGVPCSDFEFEFACFSCRPPPLQIRTSTPAWPRPPRTPHNTTTQHLRAIVKYAISSGF